MESFTAETTAGESSSQLQAKPIGGSGMSRSSKSEDVQRKHNMYPTLIPSQPSSSSSEPPTLRGINKASARAWDGTSSHLMNFNNKDDTYGKPPEGSLTEQRAQKASQHINNEVLTLVSVIRGIGEADDTDPAIVRVTFGRLFEYYTAISNKVAGILLRARRWKLVEFTGEMLYQGQDDKKIVTLLVGPDVVPTIRQYSFYEPQNQQKTESLKDKLERLNNAKR